MKTITEQWETEWRISEKYTFQVKDSTERSVKLSVRICVVLQFFQQINNCLGGGGLLPNPSPSSTHPPPMHTHSPHPGWRGALWEIKASNSSRRMCQPRGCNFLTAGSCDSTAGSAHASAALKSLFITMGCVYKNNVNIGHIQAAQSVTRLRTCVNMPSLHPHIKLQTGSSKTESCSFLSTLNLQDYVHTMLMCDMTKCFRYLSHLSIQSYTSSTGS